MIDHDIRSALKSDIAAHLLAGCPGGWGKIQANYPNISAATFWRAVKTAKNTAGEAVAGKFGAPTIVSAAAIPEFADSITSVEAGSDYLQAIRTGAILHDLSSLQRDAALLRQYATDSNGEIRDPRAFAESIKIRERISNLQVELAHEVWDLAYQIKFYDLMVEIVVQKVEPERQLETMLALKALNDPATSHLKLPNKSGK
jgi:hypothetical protein